MGGKGNELIHMTGPFEFQITDAITHRDRPFVWPQTNLMDDLGFSTVSGQGMILIEANADIAIPAQDIGVDVICSKPQGCEDWSDPINKSTRNHVQVLCLVLNPLAIFDQTRSQLMTERINQSPDMGPIEGERGQSSRQTLRKRQLTRHGED